MKGVIREKIDEPFVVGVRPASGVGDRFNDLIRFVRPMINSRSGCSDGGELLFDGSVSFGVSFSRFHRA